MNAAPPERPRRVVLLLAVAAFVIAADVISKAIVVATMPGHPNIRLLGGALTITLTRNGGAAFSIGTSMTVVFSLIAVGVIFFIVRTSRRLGSAPWAVTLGLLLGGACGNLVDRIFRTPGLFRGNVVDFIEVTRYWPVFNLADSAIVCGGVLAVLLATRGIRLDGSRDGHGGSGRRGGGTQNRQRVGAENHERDGAGNHQRDGEGSGSRAREGPG